MWLYLERVTWWYIIMQSQKQTHLPSKLTSFSLAPCCTSFWLFALFAGEAGAETSSRLCSRSLLSRKTAVSSSTSSMSSPAAAPPPPNTLFSLLSMPQLHRLLVVAIGRGLKIQRCKCSKVHIRIWGTAQAECVLYSIYFSSFPSSSTSHITAVSVMLLNGEKFLLVVCTTSIAHYYFVILQFCVPNWFTFAPFLNSPPTLFFIEPHCWTWVSVLYIICWRWCVLEIVLLHELVPSINQQSSGPTQMNSSDYCSNFHYTS